jgi:hypothetical protein
MYTGTITPIYQHMTSGMLKHTPVLCVPSGGGALPENAGLIHQTKPAHNCALTAVMKIQTATATQRHVLANASW